VALDLNKTALQVRDMASQISARQSDWQAKLRTALDAMSSADAQAVEEKRQRSKVEDTWFVPQIADSINGRYAAPNLPADFSVLAVDGSHIDVDRHAAARCYLINIGGCRLTYGSLPDAELFSKPALHASEDDLVLRNPTDSTREQSIEGAVLGFKRTVEEVKALAQLCGQSPLDTPALALVDGSLIMLGLVGHGYPDFVSEILLTQYLSAFDEMRAIAQKMRLALASYVSFPRSTDLINVLRLKACTFEKADCSINCKDKRPGQRPCDAVGGLLDRNVIEKWLEPGERSDVFKSTSSIVNNYYREHHVHFFYVNVGTEIGRVEVPQWVAEDESLLGLTHAVILDQCRKGQGYPVALMESHEQAVVTGSDRLRFMEIVNGALAKGRLPAFSSAKSMSKRVRWM